MALFKYTGLQYIPSCIENGIFASRLDNINDPFEGKGIRYPNRYRVVCLTASPYQMLMWAYYGNHRGCCIEFDVEKIKGIRQVEYIREFLSHEDMNTQEVIESLYKKGNEWSHEKEYRLVYHEPRAEKDSWKRIGENVFLIAPVKQIIFGFAAEMDEKYPEMLEYIRKYNDSNDQMIKVTKCKLKPNQYRLEEDKQFDLDEEIESLKPSRHLRIEINQAAGAAVLES